MAILLLYQLQIYIYCRQSAKWYLLSVDYLIIIISQVFFFPISDVWTLKNTLENLCFTKSGSALYISNFVPVSCQVRLCPHSNKDASASI